VGSDEGYSTLIVRSDRGKNLLENVDFVKTSVKVEEIVKLAGIKKKRARKNFAPILEGIQE
jgi:coenzyme F420-reducing hydrogenase beta subunit